MPFDPLSLPAGELRHPVSIQVKSTTRDANQQRVDAWTSILNTRASIRGIAFRETVQDAQLGSQSTHIIKIRYPGTGIRIVSGQRLVKRIGGDIFSIQEVEDILERHRVLKLTCLIIDQASN